MHEGRHNVTVGLFVLVGLMALGALVVFFGQDGSFSLTRDEYVLNARFNMATGIRTGTPATIGGIMVGRVREVGFAEPGDFASGVNVRIALDRGIQLSRGTRATTTEPGLGAGRPPIEIIPGPPDAPLLASGERIEGTMAGMVESLLPPEIVSTFDRTATQIGEASAALTPALKELTELLQRREPGAVDLPGGPQGNLSSALARLDTLLKNANAVLGDSEAQNRLREIIENVHRISTDGVDMAAELKAGAGDFRAVAADTRTLIGNAQTTWTKLDTNVDTIARSVIENLDKSAKMFESMYAISDGISKGKGTFGMLATDDRLYQAMVLTFQRLAKTIEEFGIVAEEWQKGKIKIAF